MHFPKVQVKWSEISTVTGLHCEWKMLSVSSQNFLCKSNYEICIKFPSLHSGVSLESKIALVIDI